MDKKRLLNKYKKIRLSKGILFSLLYIIFFAVRGILNNFILFFLKNTDNKQIKTIIFIEPINQGFGDLFFQTLLFKALKQKEFTLKILVNKKHASILDNNPDIDEICSLGIKSIFSIFKSKSIVIGLGRSTFTETFILALSKNRIILDKDIKKWIDTFLKYSNTIAWIELSKSLLNIEMNAEIPQIYFSNKELNSIQNNKKPFRIGIIYGVTNKTKKFKNINNLIALIPDRYEILLLGSRAQYTGDRKVENLTNISYRETILYMATCSHIIGTEGSLIQIASSLNEQVYVIDEDNRFIKNAHPDLTSKAKIFFGSNIVNDLINNL